MGAVDILLLEKERTVVPEFPEGITAEKFSDVTVKVDEAPAFKTNPTRESTDKAASDIVNPDKDVKGSNTIVSAQATSPKA